ncbi:ATP-binding cassette domain-containing protein [Microbacterium sp. DT81.1]|uniref:ATP-binding cassette domain-containing protein n=1 Tax=Microbacterium sp. DT81.1 TaxID=3393413 RepID=UPI003CF33785
MPDGQVLEFSGVTKRFGPVTAVSEFTARVEPGAVTGFLGPNGAGKTTSLRILLGLVRATEGTATIGGVPYAKLSHPLQTVGAALEASSFHPGRTAANHLKVYAQAAGLPASRIDDAIGLVGLSDVAGRRVGGFSLGMRQRLGLAYTLLGDPGVLVLDEPANGLDPEGIKWMRGLLRQLAREGRTVFVSSHLLSEVSQTVDSLLIIARGRLVFQGQLDELSDQTEQAVVVDAPDRAALADALRSAGVAFEVLRSGFTVRAADTVHIGAVAASAGVALSSLQRRGPSLEEIFLELVDGARVHESAAPAVGGAAAIPDDAVADEATTPAASTAGFSVASTGVIDVIPASEAEPDDDVPPVDDVPPDPVDEEPVEEPAAEAEDDSRSDSDADADRFFAAYDETAIESIDAETAEPETESSSGIHEPLPDPTEEPPDEDSGDTSTEDEGGERR